MENNSKITRGSIVLCELANNKGTSVQSGIRPCIVISNEKCNTYSSTVSVIPLTSANKKPLPVHVELNNLPKTSIALVEQLTVIDKTKIIKLLDNVDFETMCKLDRAIALQFALWNYTPNLRRAVTCPPRS